MYNAFILLANRWTKLYCERWAVSDNFRYILNKKLFKAVSLDFFRIHLFLVKTISKLSKQCGLWPWSIKGSDTRKHVIISAKNLVYVVNWCLVTNTSKKTYCLISNTYCFGIMRIAGTLNGSCNFGTNKYMWSVKCLVVAF